MDPRTRAVLHAAANSTNTAAFVSVIGMVLVLNGIWVGVLIAGLVSTLSLVLSVTVTLLVIAVLVMGALLFSPAGALRRTVRYADAIETKTIAAARSSANFGLIFSLIAIILGLTAGLVTADHLSGPASEFIDIDDKPASSFASWVLNFITGLFLAAALIPLLLAAIFFGVAGSKLRAAHRYLLQTINTLSYQRSQFGP